MFNWLANMKIRKKLMLFTMFVLIISMAGQFFVSFVLIREQADTDMEHYKKDETEKNKQLLKNYVDIAYEIVNSNYQDSQNNVFLEKQYGHRLKNIIDIAVSVIEEKKDLLRNGKLTLEQVQHEAMLQIKKMRYDRGVGYIWINDTGLPYPRMIMHPTVPSLDSTVLDDSKYDCAFGKKKNLFQAFVEICNEKGEGFVDYLWPKPTKDGLGKDQPKLSYVRLVKEWNWVIGTGIYVDDAMAKARKHSMDTIKNMRYNDGAGYIWISDTTLPYPKMLMHPEMPHLEEKVMDDPKYDVAFEKKKNLYQAYAEICREKNGGFVDYLWSEKDVGKKQLKLSCIRLFKPWGWVIGTASYTGIEQASVKKQSSVSKQIKDFFIVLSIISVFVTVVALALLWFISTGIAGPVSEAVKLAMYVAEGDLSRNVEAHGKSETALLFGAMKQMTETLRDIQKETHGLIRAVQEGKLDTRGNADGFSGCWHELIAGMNNLIVTLVKHIDNIPIPSMIIDRDFNICYMSKAGADITGMSQTRLIGRKCYDILRISDCGTENCACGKAMQTRCNEKREADARPGDRMLHISYTGVPLEDQEGEVIGATEVIVDQTAIINAMDRAMETAAVLLDSVNDLSVSSQQISGTSNEQAAAVKEIVSTMEDSDRLARSIAAKIDEVTEIANTTKNVVADGFSIIKQSFAKMDQIKNSNSETITEIKSLGDRIESIWEIVNMINGIADQTRIIAFNAELEASSAGDAGKNFQIVATEIRRLADSTVSSTGEIRSKISEIQNSSDKLIVVSEDGTEKIAEGWELSGELHKVFEEILSSSELSAKSADQIALSINQQVSAFEQILLTLKQISEGIDSFVASTKATTHASEKLREMADSLYTCTDNMPKG
ncbi:MAG: PAS domain-containing protein [Desulfobacterales bacterium]|nr:PAS domain-containing protein [Desulfobacterales bacterium]